jgi:predicted  nucleic acid-binding Zn-ribbon protein
MSYKPFQELIFLIRDWSYPDESSYGENGGKQYLDTMMAIGDNQTEQSKLRSEITSYFSNISCFLMPHPGLKVASGKFTPSDIEPKFIKNLNDFAAMVFNPEKLVIKQIAGKNINGRIMFDSFKIYMDAFKNNEKLKPETIYDATCRANNGIVFGDAKVYYTDEMNKKCFQSFSLEPNELQQYYEKVRNHSIEKFNQEKQNKCEVSSKRYLDDLEKWIEEQFRNCATQNLLTRINEVTEKLKKSTEEKEQLNGSIENFKKQLSNITKQLSDTKEQLNITTTKLSSTKEQLNSTQKQLDSSKTHLETAKIQLVTCSAQLESNKTQLDSTTKKLTNCNTDKYNDYIQLSTCSARLESSKRQLDSTTNQLTNCNTDKNKYYQQLVDINAKLSEEETQLKTCNQDIAKKHYIIDSLNEDLDNAYRVGAGDQDAIGCRTYHDCYFCRNHNRCCFYFKGSTRRGICTCVDDRTGYRNAPGECH